MACHRGSNIWLGWIKINFSKIGPKQKQTNVQHSETEDIINGNPQNICFNVKKTVSVLKTKTKVVYDLMKNKLLGPLLKEHNSQDFVHLKTL